jgi:hypothetical protein
MVYYLLFLDAGIKRYDFCKIGLNSDSDFDLKICLNTGRPRGCFLLEDTGLGGLAFWSVGSYGIWMAQIWLYRFG